MTFRVKLGQEIRDSLPKLAAAEDPPLEEGSLSMEADLSLELDP